MTMYNFKIIQISEGIVFKEQNNQSRTEVVIVITTRKWSVAQQEITDRLKLLEMLQKENGFRMNCS